MKVLIACEFSGIVREAFAKRGHQVVSCDLLPTEQPCSINAKHYQGDVFDIINNRGFVIFNKNTFSYFHEFIPDMMIAHPPCTYLANSGVQHLHKDKDRWQKLIDAEDFFLKLLNSNIDKICIENPVPHGYANLPQYSQIIKPNHFGHEVTKRTCLWLKNLPKLRSTNIVSEGPRYIRNGKSNGSAWYQLPPKDRQKHRSRTFQGIADAIASQWG